MTLHSKKCIPCEQGGLPLAPEEVLRHSIEVPLWRSREGNKHIYREFQFKNFTGAMAFVNRVAELAEAEGHHPDIHIFYNRVRLELQTHAIGGLSENDFILAAKIDMALNGAL